MSTFIILVNDMKRLITFEYYKLFHKKTIWCFLILCILVNVLALNYNIRSTSEERIYNLFDLAELYERYPLSARNSVALQEERLEISSNLFSAGSSVSEQQMKDVVMLGRLYEQTASLETYDAYLENIEIQAQERLQSPIFAQPGTFSYRNLQSTPKAYRFLHDVHIVPDFDDGILLFTQNRLTDALLFIIALLFMMQIFVSERENGTWSLIKSMKHGHAHLLSAKFAAACSVITVLILLFYGLNYLLISQTVGFGDTSRAIQSVEGHFTSIFPLSVQQYLLLLIPVKIICVLSLCCLFAMLCLFTRSSIFASVIGISIYAVEYVLWYSIYENSPLGPLKYLNILLLFMPDTIFAGYNTVNFFSYPLSNLTGGFIMLILCLCCGLLFSYLLYNNESSLTLNRKWKLMCPRIRRETAIKKRRPKGLWSYEFYKQAVIGKGAILFAVFLCVQVFLFFSSHYFIGSEEFYYRSYSEVLNGEFSEEKEQYLADEADRFEAIKEEQMTVIQRYNNGEIDAMKQAFLLDQIQFNQTQFNALNNVTYQYKTLQTLQIGEGLEVEYIYRTPWERLLDSNAQKGYALRLEIAFLFLLLILSSSGAIEKTASMDKLIAVSVVGKKGISFRKLTLYIILATVIMLCSFLPESLKIIQVYGIEGFDSPAASYFLQEVFPPGITLGGCLILEYVLFYLMILFMTIVTYLVSEKVGNRIITMLIGTTIFLIPTLVLLLI